MPGSVLSEFVSFRKTSSSVDWCVEVFKLSDVLSAISFPW